MTPGHPLGGIGLPSTRAASSICIKKLLLPTNCKQAYLECSCTFTHSGRGANLTPLTKFVSTRPNSLHLSRHPTTRMLPLLVLIIPVERLLPGSFPRPLPAIGHTFEARIAPEATRIQASPASLPPNRAEHALDTTPPSNLVPEPPPCWSWKVRAMAAWCQALVVGVVRMWRNQRVSQRCLQRASQPADQPPFSPSPIPSTAPSSAPRKKQIPSNKSKFLATNS
jgi:hypothetical protein